MTVRQRKISSYPHEERFSVAQERYIGLPHGNKAKNQLLLVMLETAVSFDQLRFLLPNPFWTREDQILILHKMDNLAYSDFLQVEMRFWRDFYGIPK